MQGNQVFERRCIHVKRAEQRRLERAASKNPTYTLNKLQIDKIKKDALNEATDRAFILMIGLPVWVLHNNYPQLMKKEVDGKGREERFTDLLIDLYDSFQKGYLSLDDIFNTLKEEAGVDIRKKGT